ncbi:MAG: type II toxin-antitoxin system VapC family toxin [Oscillospiraceae bacterium]|nr:type II toxin-antitoxin system VapC family toxin [Oscillospiraceae bacterium]
MILLDTHAIYWFLSEDTKLPEHTRQLIESDRNVFVSILSFWEMSIKSSIGKMELPASVTAMIQECKRMGFTLLPIEPAHLERLKFLPKIHGDPFDRLLICQAQEESLTLVTRDENIPKYDVRTFW